MAFFVSPFSPFFKYIFSYLQYEIYCNYEHTPL